MEFTKLAQCIKQFSNSNNTFFLFGTVKNANPLIITVNGLDFAADEILMNADIREKIVTNNYFSIGNKVLLINIEGELILICRVV